MHKLAARRQRFLVRGFSLGWPLLERALPWEPSGLCRIPGRIGIHVLAIATGIVFVKRRVCSREVRGT